MLASSIYVAELIGRNPEAAYRRALDVVAWLAVSYLRVSTKEQVERGGRQEGCSM
jgi:hypothetical protein